jgi:hypothetical protein
MQDRTTYDKQRYLKNKELLSQQVVCECGQSVRRDSLPRHIKTAFHLAYKNQEPTDLYICECGTTMNSKWLKNHLRTNKHLKFMQQFKDYY